MKKFAYIDATSVDTVPSLLGRRFGQAQVLAGGTDLVGELKEYIATPDRVVNLKSIPGLDYIRQEDDGLKIGPLTTLADIETSTLINDQYSVLQQAVSAIASPQIRNVGTIAGNICQRPRCWYYRSEDFDCLKNGGDTCYSVRGVNRYHAIIGGGPCYIVHPSDSAVALMSLNASVKIQGPRGPREEMLDDFFVLPELNIMRENGLRANEFVTEIIVPASKPNTKGIYVKVRERDAIDFAMASVAVTMTMSGNTCSEATVVLGGVAPVPWRVPDVEQFLQGKQITEDVASAAAEMALREADPMSDNSYKIEMTQNIVSQAILDLA
ncbi:MAG: xanthine dehydrogenase family protein subunit M [Candidatus Latescibacteria bacterium]|jgi:xanthine dehydrogenase YagS FAD-binding subunit|nr:xanthine dehydrogenase family protein subunit M [Candidatus Latescibacterota bacterium]